MTPWNRIGLDRDHIWAYFHRSPYSLQRKKMLKAAGLSFTPPPAPPTEVQPKPAPVP